MTNDQTAQECTIEDYRKSLHDMYEQLEHREKYIRELENRVDSLMRENDKLKNFLEKFIKNEQGIF